MLGPGEARESLGLATRAARHSDRVDDRSYAARHSPEWRRRSGRVVNNPKIYLSQLYKACSTNILVKIELKMRACEKTTENLQILAKKDSKKM